MNFKALTLAAVVSCLSSGEFPSPPSKLADTNSETLTLTNELVRVSATLRAVKDSTIPECGGSLLYVNAVQGAAVFCSSVEHSDPEFYVLQSRVGDTFLIEGYLHKTDGSAIRIRGLSDNQNPLFPLYHLQSITDTENFPTHIDLLLDGYTSFRKDTSEERLSGICGRRNRYIISFDNVQHRSALEKVLKTELTFCSPLDISGSGGLSGLGHRLDYRKDRAGQPIYVVDELKLVK